MSSVANEWWQTIKLCHEEAAEGCASFMLCVRKLPVSPLGCVYYMSCVRAATFTDHATIYCVTAESARYKLVNALLFLHGIP